MWPPSEVVPRHRKRATVIWVLLLLLIMSYTVWLFLDVLAKMKNPSIRVTIKSDSYEFPTLSMCFITHSGCDTEDPAYCLLTARVSILGENGFTITEHLENNLSHPSEVFKNCLDIRLNEIPEVEPVMPSMPRTCTLQVFWIPDYFGNATVQAFTQMVSVYVTDPNLAPHGDHSKTTYLSDFPYNRLSVGEDFTSLRITNVVMEMTETINLSQESTKTYVASSMLETEYRTFGDQVISPLNQTWGLLLLKLRQSSLSYTVRREIHPLEWAEIIGNIGGCWELLLILWGALFVTMGTGEPRLEGRNFTSTRKRAAESVRAVAICMRCISSSSRTGQTPSTPVHGLNGEISHSLDKEGRLNAQRAAIPGPALNPASSGSLPHPTQRFPSQSKGESEPPPMTSEYSVPCLPGMFRHQVVRPNGFLSSASFRTSFRKISADIGDSSTNVDASMARPVPSSFPVPNDRKIETKKRKLGTDESHSGTNESKVELWSPGGH